MRKKKILSGLIIGILLVALASGIAAFASTGQRTLTAHFNNIRIIIDGETITPRDGTGNRVEPFTVEGTTYVPLRAIAEAFGTDVRWDGSTSSVIITSQDGGSPPPSQPSAPTGNRVRLTSLDFLAEDGGLGGLGSWGERDSRANNGVSQADAVLLTVFGRGGTRDYLLNNEFSSFTGTVFLEYESRSTRYSFTFSIWGDGELLHSVENVTAGFLPQSFNVDTSGVNVLRIGFTKDTSWGSGISTAMGISGATLER